MMKVVDPPKSITDTLESMKLADGGCPVGTVPVRRFTKKDLTRHKLLPEPVDNFVANGNNFDDSKARRKKPLKGYNTAIVSTVDNPNNKFGGASMIAAIYNPRSTVGFWPKEVFDDFGNYATRVEWGGVVYSPAGVLLPPMGTGNYPIIKSALSIAYCRNIALLDDKGQYIDISNSNLPTTSTNSLLYSVADYPNYGLGSDYNHTILYGGPGEL
ncbi:hypothetical protein BC332_06383 [Capsicum chinense]|nr:hypothetical protein BC332_06383 [Capsicum chinense]